MNGFVKKRVHNYFWEQDLNCASSALLVISEYFDVKLEKQVLNAAVGMHGAGGYRAQCGIVEGVLMSIGIVGRAKNIADDEVTAFCKTFAGSFESEFASLDCRVLRPCGFNDDDPPHLCEDLTVRGISHGLKMIAEWLDESL